MIVAITRGLTAEATWSKKGKGARPELTLAGMSVGGREMAFLLTLRGEEIGRLREACDAAMGLVRSVEPEERERESQP